MIYISTACVQHDKVIDSILELADSGYTSLELSGGTQPYPELVSDLLSLKVEKGLDFVLHNYFPPPPIPFVVNLASLDDHVHSMSMEHCKRAMELSHKLGAKRYGFHAGFFIDVQVSEIGGVLSKVGLFDPEAATDRFCESFESLTEFCAKDIDLYLENNVLSQANFNTYGQNPFMLTDAEAYFELKRRIDFKLLLDIAHLKVSSNSLGLDLEKELQQLLPESDYLHISDNDGLSDTNTGFLKGTALYDHMQNHPLTDKVATIEVYSGAEDIRLSYDNIKELIETFLKEASN